jgi:ribosome-binding factor A
MLHSRRASKESAMSRSFSKPRSASHRLERVGELIRHAVADILARGEVRDEAFDRHPLTIRAVRMSPDLKLATIRGAPLGPAAAEAIVPA